MGAAIPATTLSDITSADWSLALDATEGGAPGAGIGEVVQGLDDVDQCIRIICTTPMGDDPLRPTFAWDMGGIIDLPVTLAIPLLVAALVAAIELWEPRVTVLNISAMPDGETPDSGAHWDITVTWQLNLAAAVPSQTTKVTIPRNN
jgi:phage baseplate assembly protein W